MDYVARCCKFNYLKVRTILISKKGQERHNRKQRECILIGREISAGKCQPVVFGCALPFQPFVYQNSV